MLEPADDFGSWDDYAEVYRGCKGRDMAQKDKNWGLSNTEIICSGDCYNCGHSYWKLKEK